MDKPKDISNDDSGIKSLSGFAYQIRVFIYYMSQLTENTQMEFETLEDVVVKNTYIDNDFIDNKSDSFRSLLKDSDGYCAIQVKRTKIGNSSKNKILFNWLLLESKYKNVNKYILYTDEDYGNNGELFDDSYENLYKSVINSNKKSTALISKVKSEFGSSPGTFKKAYEKIKSNYVFETIKNLDNHILDRFALHFRKSAVSDLIFSLRVKELVRDITGEIINAVYNKNSYVCTFKHMMQKIEYISDCIKENHYEPDFTSFKKAKKVNLSDPVLLQSREYLQLVKCNLPEKRIEEHLIFLQYYESIRYRLLEDYKLSQVENIETTTFENFCIVKDDLEAEKDSPLKRLNETKKMDNYYAPKNQTRYGSCIYLTKEDVENDIKISWEDEK